MKLAKLALTGVTAGVVLAGSMKLIRKVTGNPSEILLYNVDYMPYLKRFKDNPLTGYGFHYATCIASTIGLYYMLKPIQLEKQVMPYVFVYSAGSGALFFLSMLTDELPEHTDKAAWTYWTGSHVLYGIAVASGVRKIQ